MVWYSTDTLYLRDGPFDIGGGGNWYFSSRQVIFSLFLHYKLFFSKVNATRFLFFFKITHKNQKKLKERNILNE